MSKPEGYSFTDKHPKDIQIDPRITQAIQNKTQNERMGCAAAHRLARELAVPPAEVGVALDLLNYKITRCQLGLFGYQPAAKPVHPASFVAPELAKALEQAVNSRTISCAACWAIADACKLPRGSVANACEALGLKIRPCQLGAF